MPIAFVVLPSVGLALVLNDRVELAFVGFATCVGLFSLVRGFLRHRVGRALVLLVPGISALWLGILWPPLHHAAVPHAVVMALGGSLVATAHFLNSRLTAKRRSCKG